MSPTASKPNTPARMYAAGHGLEELDTPTRKKKSLFYTGDESESEVEFEKEEEEMSMKGEMEERGACTTLREFEIRPLPCGVD